MRIYRADLHMHTILSPCGDYGMTPVEIVFRSKNAGLDIIAVTDHNSAGNAAAVMDAAKGSGIKVIGGMEICTSEEVHVLAYFDRIEDLLNMELIVQENLPGQNDTETFGDQVLLDSEDKIIGLSSRLLIGSTNMDLDRVVELIHRNTGMVIAAHVDRDLFSIISQLGFIPDGLDLHALELSSNQEESVVEYQGYPVVYSSDAHYLDDIGRKATDFLLETPSVEELKLAVKGIRGRRIVR